MVSGRGQHILLSIPDATDAQIGNIFAGGNCSFATCTPTEVPTQTCTDRDGRCHGDVRHQLNPVYFTGHPRGGKCRRHQNTALSQWHDWQMDPRIRFKDMEKDQTVSKLLWQYIFYVSARCSMTATTLGDHWEIFNTDMKMSSQGNPEDILLRFLCQYNLPWAEVNTVSLRMNTSSHVTHVNDSDDCSSNIIIWSVAKHNCAWVAFLNMLIY